MKLPVDVTIYAQNMKNHILAYENYFEMLADYGICDRNKFETLLDEHLTTFALNMYESTGCPNMTFDQFDECIGYAVVDYHLDSLQEQGLIESVITEDCELGYRTTPAGHMATLINNISLN